MNYRWNEHIRQNSISLFSSLSIASTLQQWRAPHVQRFSLARVLSRLFVFSTHHKYAVPQNHDETIESKKKKRKKCTPLPILHCNSRRINRRSNNSSRRNSCSLLSISFCAHEAFCQILTVLYILKQNKTRRKERQKQKWFLFRTRKHTLDSLR
jgi:hypothetical protein